MTKELVSLAKCMFSIHRSYKHPHVPSHFAVTFVPGTSIAQLHAALPPQPWTIPSAKSSCEQTGTQLDGSEQTGKPLDWNEETGTCSRSVHPRSSLSEAIHRFQDWLKRNEFPAADEIAFQRSPPQLSNCIDGNRPENAGNTIAFLRMIEVTDPIGTI